MYARKSGEDAEERSEHDYDFFELDEGWWTSILAEEEQFSTPNQPAANDQNITKASPLSIAWEKIKGFHERDEILNLEVHGFNRGGLLVKGENIQGFVPISHLVEFPNEYDDSLRDQLLEGYVGKSMKLKVIECDPTQERVVFSQRAALSGEGCRKRLFHELKIGNIVCGNVTNVTEFGVFVDLGGVEGLVHVSELSWGRVEHPCEVLKVGQKINAQILQITEETERVALSYKRLFHNPWSDLLDYHQPGDITTATITSITRFGAFARMKEGIEGLIHISSMNFGSDVKEIKDILNPGQMVTVKILHIDINRKRLGLSLLDYE